MLGHHKNFGKLSLIGTFLNIMSEKSILLFGDCQLYMRDLDSLHVGNWITGKHSSKGTLTLVWPWVPSLFSDSTRPLTLNPPTLTPFQDSIVEYQFEVFEKEIESFKNFAFLRPAVVYLMVTSSDTVAGTRDHL